MSLLLPPSELGARLTAGTFSRRHLSGLPRLDSAVVDDSACSRRKFLRIATLALSGVAGMARADSQLVFSPQDESTAKSAQIPSAPSTPLRLGEIPADFWTRPRELWLRRQGRAEQVKVVYWQDGQIQAEGYWQACAILRDVRANLMTTMDPTVLDILRGLTGYYQAWNWPHPIVVTSGYRTLATNKALAGEGAAKNSMHLYGRAADLYIPGIPQKDVGNLARYFAQGGVGFYPGKGFTHLDTGALRVWRG